MLCQIQQENDNHTHSSYIDDNSNKEEGDVIQIHDSSGLGGKEVPDVNLSCGTTTEERMTRVVILGCPSITHTMTKRPFIS